MLSGIQHYQFCKRQWALIHVEQQWEENYRTMEGNILHEKVHDSSIKEKRGHLIISRAMRVHSYELGISGECDVVEFKKDEEGVDIPKLNGKYAISPVEYKRGKPKTGNEDILQLIAQVICLEEMFRCEISIAYLYYHEIRRRQEVVITDELKNKVHIIYEEMHQLLERKYTPNVTWKKQCNACSLKDICLPVLGKKNSVKEYMGRAIVGE
ncbi:MAG: CRISPR-associated protein Cas4 [Lachnospiraceae bacterium]